MSSKSAHPSEERAAPMIGILIAVLLAALVYFLCMVLGLPSIVAIIAAVLVLLAGIPTGGYGIGGRFGGGTRV
jgi:high-affinity Fe2+/Pb2+ permease